MRANTARFLKSAVVEIDRPRGSPEIDRYQLIKISLSKPRCAGPGGAQRVKCLLNLTPAPANLFPQGSPG
jgi:hypothetical protein